MPDHINGVVLRFHPGDAQKLLDELRNVPREHVDTCMASLAFTLSGVLDRDRAVNDMPDSLIFTEDR